MWQGLRPQHARQGDGPIDPSWLPHEGCEAWFSRALELLPPKKRIPHILARASRSPATGGTPIWHKLTGRLAQFSRPFTEKTLAADVPLPAVRMLRYVRPVRTHLMVVGAVVAVGLATSCAETDPNRGAVGLAGAGTVGEANSANGGHGGAGGAGGDAASTDLSQGGTAGKCWELKAWSPDGCGTCEMTMDQYCATVDCTPDPLPSCEGLPAAYSIDEGCGLLQLRMSGHGGAIYTESVYDLETRKLTFYYDKGGRSAGCMPELRVGIEPTCERWTTLCEGAGGG